mgnify:CR=1 FL=1
MGIFGDLIKAAVKTVTLPIQVVKDVVDVAKGEEPKNTAKTVESIMEDVFEGDP